MFHFKSEADKKELNKELRKHKITAKQIGGDDGYQWTVLINGREYINGLTKREVPYYKKKALERCKTNV